MVIGIELNHVIRNINKQLLKYYAREYDPSMDYEEMDDKIDVINTLEFSSKKEKYRFTYVDYPYEIFGCAKQMYKNAAVDLNNFIEGLKNDEENDVKVLLFSMNEDALTIQSTFFFLSKIGCRVREMVFPTSVDEIWSKCDVIVSADKEVIGNAPQDKKCVLINKPWNEMVKDKSLVNYDSLEDLFKDNDFIKKVL